MGQIHRQNILQHARAHLGTIETYEVKIEAPKVRKQQEGLDKNVRNMSPFIFTLMTKHIGVRFVYEEEISLDAADTNIADIPAASAQLPPDLPEQLQYAVERSDMEPIVRVIGDIRSYQLI
ncbi:MAG: hypothetical protein GY801_07640 [bacterium]|nr:hypothetical protein [bacterium]